jgi:DNA-binding CsgD family transcriptional regulator
MDSMKLLPAIDAIYDTVGAPEQWPGALDCIARVFDAKCAVLVTRRDDGSMATVCSPGHAEAQRDYDSGWWREDIASRRGLEQGYLASGNTVCDTDVVTAEERQNHPFFAVFRRRHGLGGFLAGSISPTPNVATWLSIQQPDQAPAFEATHREMLEILMKHCERALVLSSRMEDLRLANSSLEEMLAKLGCGVILLDATGRVSHANAAGQALLDKDLPLIGGRLSLTRGPQGNDRSNAISTALRDTPEDRIACSRPIIIPRADNRPLVAYVLPLRTTGAAQILGPRMPASAMVIVVDVDDSNELDPALIRDYLGLTLGEAKVAAWIGQGRSPRETAGQLGISEETVRTTLKRIFSKTGVSRQSELAVILSRFGLIANEAQDAPVRCVADTTL